MFVGAVRNETFVTYLSLSEAVTGCKSENVYNIKSSGKTLRFSGSRFKSAYYLNVKLLLPPQAAIFAKN